MASERETANKQQMRLHTQSSLVLLPKQEGDTIHFLNAAIA